MARDQQVDKAYLAAEAKARVEIDRQLATSGWLVQARAELNLYAAQGVAVREFTMADAHGRADYLLFVDRQAVGTIEAKPKGTTLTEVEIQGVCRSALRSREPSEWKVLPRWRDPLPRPLPEAAEGRGGLFLHSHPNLW